MTAGLVATRADPGDVLDRLIVFRPAGQVAALVVMLGGAAVFAVRLDRFDAAQAHLSDPLDIGA